GLRRMVGDDAFWATLRRVVKEHGGKVTRWADFRHAFEATLGRDADLGWYFEQWVDRKGLPEVALDAAGFEPAAAGKPVMSTVKVVQKQVPAYRLSLPFQVETARGTETATGVADAAVSVVTLGLTAEPGRVVLDPDFHVPR